MDTIAIRDLRFGHEEGAPSDVVNVRRTDRDAGLASLAASIEAHGLITPLTVVEGTGRAWFVVDGNRRLAALRQLVETGVKTEADEVPVSVAMPGRNAREIGLAANTVRVALHEADQYEAFRELADEGLSEAAIASRFGMEEARVRRILAIGRLSPRVLAAWRSNEFERDVIGCIRAFTLGSVKDQDRVFGKLCKIGQLYPYAIRQELGAGNQEASRNLTFVGADAYRAAGGHLVEDLFGTDHVVGDPALAKRLADERLAAECSRLISEGWSWASPATDLPDSASWSWQRVSPKPAKATRHETSRLKAARAVVARFEEADETGPELAAAEAEIASIEAAQELRRYTDEDKARSGCVVSIGYSGELAVRFGVVKPEASKSEKKSGKADPAEPKEPGISTALSHRLSIQLTRAAQEAMKASPAIAVAALVAGAMHRGYGAPMRVRLEGFGPPMLEAAHDTFAELFSRLLLLPEEQLVDAAAQVAARAIDLQEPNGRAAAQTPATAAFLSAFAPDVLTEQLRAAFDAPDYFGAAPKVIALRAIEEALNADEARKAGKLRKAELVAFAVANVPPTGWLPPEIRHPGYSGPGSVAPVEFREAAE